MIKMLHPLEQLHLLNKDVKHLSLTKPLIVVGGQAVAYWVWRYQNMFEKEILANKKLFSFDIDYMCAKEDIPKIAQAWDLPFSLNTCGQPPSIALLKTQLSHGSIKEYQNLYFYNEQIDGANIIDIIDTPAGFNRREIYTHLDKLCEPYFEDSSAVYILNPIACLRARLANINGKFKRSSISFEIERVRSLLVTIVCFLFKKMSGHNFKDGLSYFTLFKETITNSDVAQTDAQYGLNLYTVFNYFINHRSLLEKQNINSDFFDKFLPYSLESYKRLVMHKKEIISRRK